MDNVEFSALLGVVKNLPDKDITRAESAAARAEAAAESITGLNYVISVTGTKLLIEERSDS